MVRVTTMPRDWISSLLPWENSSIKVAVRGSKARSKSFARTVKHVTGLIFRLALFSFSDLALRAECTPLAQTTGAYTFWNRYSETYGEARFPVELSVCTGRKYFQEIKGGSKMLSALDRQKLRIVRRDNKLKHLGHELAHAYLDVRWQVLPYSVSEPLVAAMEAPEKCEITGFRPVKKDILAERWKNRAALPRCELIELLRDVLYSEADVRLGLLLR